MANPYLGEVRLFAFTFAPKGWALCDGQLLSISQNVALFSLIGTTYGGDGQSTFALPDLQGRSPIHQGQGSGLSNRVIGSAAGVEAVTLNAAQMPAHSHVVNADGRTGSGNIGNPAGRLPGAVGSEGLTIYSTNTATTTMSPAMIGIAGSGLPHENMPPFLVMNYCIALQGIFPSQN